MCVQDYTLYYTLLTTVLLGNMDSLTQHEVNKFLWSIELAYHMLHGGCYVFAFFIIYRFYGPAYAVFKYCLLAIP